MDRLRKALDKNSTRSYWHGKSAAGKKINTLQPHDDIEYESTKSVDIPQHVLAENRLIAGNRGDVRATSFSLLRTQVLHAMRNNGWASVAVTGPVAGVGKSLIAANLAISISLEVNQTVLLVDADLRRPSIHKKFDFEPQFGLSDYLVNDVSLDQLLVNPGFKRLVVLPGKGSTPESSELLSSPKMQALTKELSSHYQSRIIIYDLPPLLNTDDAMVLLPLVDSAILVVENGKNTESEVVKSMRLLESTNLIGTVLNKSDEELEGYI